MDSRRRISLPGPYICWHFQRLIGAGRKNSRLFFIRLGTIRVMQDLVKVNNVRFLVENAGSMVDLHYQAFCKLLGLPLEPKSQYVWDPADSADFGFGVTRKRNFFRAHEDSQTITEPRGPDFTQGGPLLSTTKPTSLPPLLRTRKLLPFEVCWSSTLYQPCALIWEYDFWGGCDAFSQRVPSGNGKIPSLPWQKFLSLLQSSTGGSNGFDEAIVQLIPMFNGSQIRIPIRILKEREILQLSGLDGLWANTSIDDAERLPEKVMRDYSGNSFHADLISSAIGNDRYLWNWIHGVADGSTAAVADKNTFLQVYTHLCQEVEQLGIKQGVKLGSHLVKEFPKYPDPIDPQRQVPLPKIHDAMLTGPRTPKQTKQERFGFNCDQAVIHHLGVPLSQVLRSHGLESDAFRAPVAATFQFGEYFRFLFGCYAEQLASRAGRHRPSLATVSQIQAAFQRLEKSNTRLSLLDCLIAACCSNGDSRWPVGHFCGP